MNVTTRIGIILAALSSLSGIGSLLLGPPTLERALPSAVIGMLGTLVGISLISTGLREKKAAQEQLHHTGVYHQSGTIDVSDGRPVTLHIELRDNAPPEVRVTRDGPPRA